MDQVPNDCSILPEAYQNDVYRSSEEHVEQQWRLHAALSQPLRDMEPLGMLVVIRTHVSPDPVVELADNLAYLRWYAEACENYPQQLSVDRVIRFM